MCSWGRLAYRRLEGMAGHSGESPVTLLACSFSEGMSSLQAQLWLTLANRQVDLIKMVAILLRGSCLTTATFYSLLPQLRVSCLHFFLAPSGCLCCSCFTPNLALLFQWTSLSLSAFFFLLEWQPPFCRNHPSHSPSPGPAKEYMPSCDHRMGKSGNMTPCRLN